MSLPVSIATIDIVSRVVTESLRGVTPKKYALPDGMSGSNANEHEAKLAAHLGRPLLVGGSSRKPRPAPGIDERTIDRFVAAAHAVVTEYRSIVDGRLFSGERVTVSTYPSIANAIGAELVLHTVAGTTADPWGRAAAQLSIDAYHGAVDKVRGGRSTMALVHFDQAFFSGRCQRFRPYPDNESIWWPAWERNGVVAVPLPVYVALPRLGLLYPRSAEQKFHRVFQHAGPPRRIPRAERSRILQPLREYLGEKSLLVPIDFFEDSPIGDALRKLVRSLRVSSPVGPPIDVIGGPTYRHLLNWTLTGELGVGVGLEPVEGDPHFGRLGFLSLKLLPVEGVNWDAVLRPFRYTLYLPREAVALGDEDGPATPLSPFAEIVFKGILDMCAPAYNCRQRPTLETRLRVVSRESLPGYDLAERMADALGVDVTKPSGDVFENPMYL